MKILLDTHALLWAIGSPERLSSKAHDAISSLKNTVYFSPASIWEIAIKQHEKKLDAPPELLSSITRTGFAVMNISIYHADRAGRLPRLHGDPFDRMLVAQAIEDDLVLATRDSRLGGYGVEILTV